MQALICSDQPPAPLVPPAAVAQCPPGRTEIENGRCVDGVMYRVWDDNDDPLDDLAPMEQGILTLRERCAELSLLAVRITSAAVIDDILRPHAEVEHAAGVRGARGRGSDSAAVRLEREDPHVAGRVRARAAEQLCHG